MSARTGRRSVRKDDDDDDEDDDNDDQLECECEYIADRISSVENQSPISVRIESCFVAALYALAEVDNADSPKPPKAAFECTEEVAAEEKVRVLSSSPSSSSTSSMPLRRRCGE